MTTLVRVTHRSRGDVTGAIFDSVEWINPAYVVLIVDWRGKQREGPEVAGILLHGREAMVRVDEPDLAAVLNAFHIAE